MTKSKNTLGSIILIVTVLVIAISICIYFFMFGDDDTISYTLLPSTNNQPANPSAFVTPYPQDLSPTVTSVLPVTETPDSLSSPSPASTAAEMTSSLDPMKDITVSKDIQLLSFKWTYKGKDWTWTFNIPRALDDYYKALSRAPTNNYSVYITHPLDDEYIKILADKISATAQEEGYNEYETVSFAAAFVQSLPYASDEVTTGFDEYPRYPIETLFNNGGDCEDTSILLASIVRAMNYGVILIVFPKTTGISGHCAVGIKGGENVYGSYWEYEGDRYYYLETTGDGWEIGELPDEYKNSTATLYPMAAVPILTHSWSYIGTVEQIKLTVNVDNLGSAPAQDVYIKAGFDAGDDRWWNEQQSPVTAIDINTSSIYTLYLNPPSGEHTRLIIVIMCNGYTSDVSYSDWFSS